MGGINLLSFFIAAVLAGTPLLFGVLGEIVTEKAGNLNLGVEGMMFMGAVAGLAASYYYELGTPNPSAAVSAALALLAAFLCAAFGAFLFSVLTITLRANQNVTGLALTIFGTGFANFFGEAIGNASPSKYMAVSNVTKSAFNTSPFPASGGPDILRLLFSYNFMVYLAVALAVAMGIFLSRTRTGLNLRAVGESPATADAAGIRLMLYKYLATVIGGGICGLGGLYIAMNSSSGVGGVWIHNCISGKGWIAVALVIFATWNPGRALAGSLAFGALSVMRFYVALPIPAQIYDIFPYIATAAVLIAVSLRKRRENQPPAALGLAYFREER